MSDLHPNDIAEALWTAIKAVEADKAKITMADYHLHVLRELHADAVREARR